MADMMQYFLSIEKMMRVLWSEYNGNSELKEKLERITEDYNELKKKLEEAESQKEKKVERSDSTVTEANFKIMQLQLQMTEIHNTLLKGTKSDRDEPTTPKQFDDNNGFRWPQHPLQHSNSFNRAECGAFGPSNFPYPNMYGMMNGPTHPNMGMGMGNMMHPGMMPFNSPMNMMPNLMPNPMQNNMNYPNMNMSMKPNFPGPNVPGYQPNAFGPYNNHQPGPPNQFSPGPSGGLPNLVNFSTHSNNLSKGQKLEENAFQNKGFHINTGNQQQQQGKVFKKQQKQKQKKKNENEHHFPVNQKHKGNERVQSNGEKTKAAKGEKESKQEEGPTVLNEDGLDELCRSFGWLSKGSKDNTGSGIDFDGYNTKKPNFETNLNKQNTDEDKDVRKKDIADVDLLGDIEEGAVGGNNNKAPKKKKNNERKQKNNECKQDNRENSQKQPKPPKQPQNDQAGGGGNNQKKPQQKNGPLPKKPTPNEGNDNGNKNQAQAKPQKQKQGESKSDSVKQMIKEGIPSKAQALCTGVDNKDCKNGNKITQNNPEPPKQNTPQGPNNDQPGGDKTQKKPQKKNHNPNEQAKQKKNKPGNYNKNQGKQQKQEKPGGEKSENVE